MAASGQRGLMGEKRIVSIEQKGGAAMRWKHLLTTFAYRVVLLLGILTFLIGLLIQTATTSEAARTLPQEAAPVRFVQAAPYMRNIDVFVDGKTLFSNLDFGKVTGYVSLAKGSHRIQVAPTGAGKGKAVIDEMATLSSDVVYTLAVLDTKSNDYSLLAFTDKNETSSSQAKLRVYHLSPNIGAIDITADHKKIVTVQRYQRASGYLTLPGGTYTFEGRTTRNHTTISLHTTLQNGTINSLFVVGLAKDKPGLAFVVASVR